MISAGISGEKNGNKSYNYIWMGIFSCKEIL